MVIRTISCHFGKAATADDDFVVHHILNVAENGVESGVGHGCEGGVQCRHFYCLSFKRLQCPSGESEAAAIFQHRELHDIPFRNISGISRLCPTLVAVRKKIHCVNLRLSLVHGSHRAVARPLPIGGKSSHVIGGIAQFSDTVGEGRSGLNGSANDNGSAVVTVQLGCSVGGAIDKPVAVQRAERVIHGNLPGEEHIAVIKDSCTSAHRRNILTFGGFRNIVFQFQQGKFNRSVILIHQCRKVLRSRRNLRATQFIVAVADLGEDVAFCKCIGSRVMGRTESFPRGKGDIHHLDELCLIGFIQLHQRNLHRGNGAIAAQHLPNIFRDKFQHAVIGRQLSDEGRNHHTVGKAIGLIAGLVIDVHCRRGILNISVP